MRQAGLPYLSETEGVFYHLKYFQHIDTKDCDWAHTSLEDMAQYQPEEQTETSEYHARLCFYKVSSVLSSGISIQTYLDR